MHRDSFFKILIVQEFTSITNPFFCEPLKNCRKSNDCSIKKSDLIGSLKFSFVELRKKLGFGKTIQILSKIISEYENNPERKYLLNSILFQTYVSFIEERFEINNIKYVLNYLNRKSKGINHPYETAKVTMMYKKMKKVSNF